ncbi:MAG: hypothetical protein HRT87_02295 [Legionellales bacterium]|nr:hypothetical protein [Legionellales bacterium]
MDNYISSIVLGLDMIGNIMNDINLQNKLQHYHEFTLTDYEIILETIDIQNLSGEQYNFIKPFSCQEIDDLFTNLNSASIDSSKKICLKLFCN